MMTSHQWTLQPRYTVLLSLPSTTHDLYGRLLFLLLLRTIVSSISMTLASKRAAPAMEEMMANRQRRSTTRLQQPFSWCPYPYPL